MNTRPHRLHPHSLRALETVMRGPHRRGGGRRGPDFKHAQSLRQRFRRWARLYWPEALEALR